jgi:hypothetical protein
MYEKETKMKLYFVWNNENINEPPLATFYKVEEAKNFTEKQKVSCWVEECVIKHYSSTIVYEKK